MKREELKDILQNSYTQEKWIKTLQFLSGSKNLLTISLEPKAVEIKSAKAKEIVSEIVQLGSLKTTDGINLPIFDVTLQDGIKIEYNRVGVNDLLKNHILKDVIKGAIVTFHYNGKYNKNEWRFSFISKFGSDYFAETESVETNPKKYTYIFGTSEEHRTALERLYNLEQSRFRLEDFFEAFNVEPVSNNFFKEYKNFYQDFVFHISNDKNSRAIFELEKSDDVEKDIRNFVKRLLGRLVFLYFLQKKHWLGASNKNYDDGDTNFLFNLFNYNNDSKDHFYNKWLSKLFFNALNTPNRKNDDFELPDGNSVWIPFLNGGLFEEHQEPEKHREIQFSPTLFELLFKFFNGYNFTIYENSPEDHTVAVDPEMLGNIFENLLEDNSDKGAFYTPKEIVHYMTQESLIEYLKTHLSHSKEAIENLIKNHITVDFTREELKKVETLIDNVKICDPAIGSGAFPMGLLQEIFALKALIHYELGYNVWSPAKIKQDIIQNSIYGVDIEPGAVDIARLRFWLSLVVDEPTPKPLPNFDYKIMQGNSLVESYKGIDLSNVAKGNNLKVTELDRDLFGNFKETQLNITFDNAGIGNAIQEKTKKYYLASVKDKPKLKTDINKLVKEFIEYNIELRENQLDRFILQIETQNQKTKNKAQEKKIQDWLDIKEQLNANKKDLQIFLNTDERPYFLWHLFFADVFENGGFDIVIGNPPYIKEYTNKDAFDEFRNTKYYQGKMDLWYGFACKGLDWLKEGGVECFIAQNNWVTSSGASILRNEILTRSEIKTFVDFGDYKVFQSAGIQTMIYVVQKNSEPTTEYQVFYASLNDFKINNEQLNCFLDNKKLSTSYFEKYYQSFKAQKLIGSYINFYTPSVKKILNTIEEKSSLKIMPNEATNGIHSHHDYVSNAMLKILGSNFKTGNGVFALSKEEVESLNLRIKEKELIKPYYSTTKKIDKFFVEPNNDEWLIYTNSSFRDINSLNEYPNIKKHLDKFKNIITSDNKPYGLHRTRNEDFFTNEKIISIRKCAKPTFAYSDSIDYFSAAFYIIKTDRINLKYLTCFLNSKLTSFWLKFEGKLQGSNYQIDKEPLMNIPIHKPDDYRPFIELFDIINYVLSTKEAIIENVDNKHIANFIEEVIDGCFFDIYFPEQMIENNLTITENVKNHLDIAGLSDKYKEVKYENMKTNIDVFYSNLKNDVVQQRMRMYTVKSPNILKPILES